MLSTFCKLKVILPVVLFLKSILSIVPTISLGAKVLPLTRLSSRSKLKEISVGIRSEGVTVTVTSLLAIFALPSSKVAFLVMVLLATSKVTFLGYIFTTK